MRKKLHKHRNSPDNPHISEEVPTDLKRKLSEAEDSLILTKR
jgi:hypothetical protein